jgi:cell division septal protein FtsQ
MSTDDTIKAIPKRAPAAPAAPGAPVAASKRRKKPPAPAPKGASKEAPQPTARQALLSLGEQIREARRQARATERVGWGLFRDDVRRGRIIDLAGLALIVAIAISIATSPDYEVQQVNVINSKAITGEQAAHLTGILGTNIFMVDPAQVAARMRQSPFVKNATVETMLPDRVMIRVDERRPNVVWVLADSTPYLISDDGVVMSKATTLQGYIVVYDQDTQPGKLHLGDKLERQDVIDVAQRLFMKLSGESGLHISQMEYQVAGGVTVVTDTGQRVRFGDGANLDLKMREVAALVAQLSGDKQAWRVIDARAPERLAVSK